MQVIIKNQIQHCQYLAANLKVLREMYGINQSYMAKKLGISQSVYSTY